MHAKAKAEAGYRFYALYDKPSREDILAHAYAQCRSNKGAPGVDGQDFADVEAYGVDRWLAELALALRQEAYQPAPIRRVFIPKANGKLRPLGISTLRDRVCMTAAMLVLEPIFEADLPPELYAYRPGRNAQQAVVEVEELLFRGHPEVVDADLADYFGSIPHAELLKSVSRRIVDRRVLHLIRMWLDCPVEETDDRGRNAYLFGAICPARGVGAALAMPYADTEAMQAHLDEISSRVARGAHAVLLLDRAGWHTTDKLNIPKNMTLIFLPSRSPELNPVENIWQYLRANWLSNRVFETYDDIIEAACDAWNKLIALPDVITSIAMRNWAHSGHE